MGSTSGPIVTFLSMGTLILVRHGESIWNKENRFTGWEDVPLSSKGEEEARHAAVLLAQQGFRPDVAFTSYLQRAITTLHLILGEMGQLWIPETKAWQLNERHYGALQGKNKAETAEAFSPEQVHIWRRSFAVAPPVMSRDDPHHPARDVRYAGLSMLEGDFSESLRDTIARAVPYFSSDVLPLVHQGKTVLVVAHGNSLRGIIKHLEDISDDDIPSLELATGVPHVFTLGDGGQVLSKTILG